MDPQIIEWLNLNVKWIHLIVGIAWIGASFYFNWLEGNLRRHHAGLSEGVAGDLWAVHGGGFYHVEKFENTPSQLPETLHWFKWEAYMTWISGFSLMILVFYLTPQMSLIAPGVELSQMAAIGLSLAALLFAWVLYDLVCKSKLANYPWLFFVTIVSALFVSGLFLSQWFSEKATYLHLGAMIGTIMVANVFFVIIPSQRLMVSALTKGETPDPSFGKKGFQRSLHNNYFTLPVLFIMISGHYPATYGHEYGLWILLAISLIGVLVRHYFNLKNQGKRHPWILPLAAILMALVAYSSFPKTSEQAPVLSEVSYAQVKPVFEAHCISCHGAKPTAGFASPPAGIVLENAEQSLRVAHQIYMQTSVAKTMPPGNLTQMSDAERELIAQWYQTQK